MHTPLSFHSIASAFSFSSCPHIQKCTHTHHYTQSGETALHDAVNQGYEDVIDILLEANIDPDVQDKVSHMTLTVPNMKYHLLHRTCPHGLITMLFMIKFVQLDCYVYALGSILNCMSWLVHQVCNAVCWLKLLLTFYQFGSRALRRRPSWWQPRRVM